MFCAISGEPPKVPVVSRKSGLVYEQRLIQKYIDENGKDPVTGDALETDDLVEIKSSPKSAAPRPPQHSSIPSLLTALQNEYDAIVLETFTLKKHYDNLRQELAHALYANDASARVIARLLNERDQAREALSNIEGAIGTGPSSSRATAQDVEMTDSAEAATNGESSGGSSSGLSASVVALIDSTSQALQVQRRAKSKRKAPEGYATAGDLSSFSEVKSLPSMHNAKPAGVTCLALSADGKVLVTGGNDKNVQVYDRSEDVVLASLKGHTKRISRVAVSGTSDAPIGPDAATDEENSSSTTLPAHIVSASEDGKIKVWTPSGATGAKAQAYALLHTIETHSAEVTGLGIHPSGKFIGSACRNGTLALHSLEDGAELLSIRAPEISNEQESGGYVYESFAFHPDGQLVATGTAEGAIRIWDIKAGANVSTFQTGLGGKVTSLDFSENGYYLAAASDQAKLVEVWDLRKLKAVGSITVDAGQSEDTEKASSKKSASHGVSAVRFDPSLQFLAVTTDSVSVFANKSWNQLAVLAGTKNITDLQWDRSNGSIVVSCLDRTVRSFGLSA
ncbi:putative PRP19-non-snRNP spliceosome component required for DNA repair [Testicularia cyperi]|uniref:Pre-mRNA-processing factor 19 n=1 Tax=Testicularia cyperi TaxID=1882483 RepID=A0A317XYP9_9BASI|nr:putative PRP19-non-snRNP spliceosome component required for DNA repair [Testicularia cyperi]